jgi:hypothetical protein
LCRFTIAILVGFNARFREGNKWILLRAAAEAIKREIFRYRMRSGLYSEAQSKQALASMRLAVATVPNFVPCGGLYALGADY